MAIKLNISFIKCVLTLYDEMMSNGISLVYLGEFNQQIITMFTSMAKKSIYKPDDDRMSQRMLYHAMVETLENLNYHSDEVAENMHHGKGFMIIGRKENKYYIITTNKISNTKKGPMEQELSEIVNASKERLDEMYREQIQQDSKLERGHGAGLGLIDIARKTNEKIDYFFLPNDENYHTFVLKIEISSDYEKENE